LIKDTGTDPGTALQKLMELKDAGIKYVIGPYTSANAEAVLPYANENEIFLLSPSSVASSIAISGDNLYRLLPADKAQAEAMAALFKHDSIEVIIPVVRNDVWGGGLLNDAGSLFSLQGLTLDDAILYDPANVNSSDIATQVSTSIAQLQSQIPLSHIAVYLLSFSEGTEILNAASNISNNTLVRWYGSSAFANNSSLLNNQTASQFAIDQHFLSPSFAPDPSVSDLWNPINETLTTTLGRTPEVFALTTYDAVWLMVLSFVLNEDPGNFGQFKSSFEHLTQYYNGITGRTTLDENGDRKYASFNFWGIERTGGNYDWKSFGTYRNSDGQLIIY
jgi:branched-chain amino acid transport system substrate-binding protein